MADDISMKVLEEDGFVVLDFGDRPVKKIRLSYAQALGISHDFATRVSRKAELMRALQQEIRVEEATGGRVRVGH